MRRKEKQKEYDVFDDSVFSMFQCTCHTSLMVNFATHAYKTEESTSNTFEQFGGKWTASIDRDVEVVNLSCSLVFNDNNNADELSFQTFSVENTLQFN